MRAERMLRLFPRAWRERYGEELLELAGEGPLHWRQVIDIAACAADAWLSPDVRRAANGARPETAGGGAWMIAKWRACGGCGSDATGVRDGLVGAAVMLVSSAALSGLGIAARRNGFEALGEALKGLAFPVSLVFSMPFLFLRGHSRRVQIVLVLVPLAILVGGAWIASLI